MVPVCQRYPCARGRGNDRADSRDHLEFYALVGKGLGLLAAPAEHKRVSPLEPADDLAFLGLLDKGPVYLVLAHIMVSAAFAGIDEFRALTHVVEHLRIQVIVVDHYVRPLEAAQPLYREQADVSRPGPHEKNHALFHVAFDSNEVAGKMQ